MSNVETCPWGLAAGGQKYINVLAVGHHGVGSAAAGEVFCGGQRGGLQVSFGRWKSSRCSRGEARLFGWDGWRVPSLSPGDGGGLDSRRQGAQRTGHFPWSR